LLVSKAEFDAVVCSRYCLSACLIRFAGEGSHAMQGGNLVVVYAGNDELNVLSGDVEGDVVG
jgi:hypothetical protein